MRIALFTEVFLPKIDGVVTRLMGTLDHLVDMGHEVVVFAPGHPPARYAGFRVVPVRSVSFKPWYPELRVGLPTSNIAKTMERFHPHIVHAVNPIWLAAYGTMSSKRRDLPMLASFHTNVPEYTQRLGLEWITDTTERWITWIHNLAEVNLCTSQPMIEQAAAAGIKNLDLWPRAVDTQTYHPGNYSQRMRERLTDGHPEDRLLVYVGRMSKEKDLDVLRGVIARAPEGTRLAMVGSGPHLKQLEAEFAGTPTLFTGYMSGQELAEAYASADVFVFPSTTETLGLVALESMASGVPVVAARAGGIPFAVPDGVGGLLCEPHSSEDMSAQVNRLLSDESLRSALAAGGQAEMEQHSWRAATEKLVESYELAIERHWSDYVPPRWRIKTFGRPMPRAT
ncbi:glycosyltransferase family 1 protein [Brevibacterium luteolum]|uniref:glycosyltransferase family 4 protein n=1 Tax=Brevibacterium luteolum TaxID=199591 RepID=UPI001C2328A6|nr:glycosyltransferase family 1 protein [Brevibacterium luteolum]MBU8577494.1 glycosyltransferase family 1 protein [Brevibacterium luteolum]